MHRRPAEASVGRLRNASFSPGFLDTLLLVLEHRYLWDRQKDLHLPAPDTQKDLTQFQEVLLAGWVLSGVWPFWRSSLDPITISRAPVHKAFLYHKVCARMRLCCAVSSELSLERTFLPLSFPRWQDFSSGVWSPGMHTAVPRYPGTMHICPPGPLVPGTMVPRYSCQSDLA